MKNNTAVKFLITAVCAAMLSSCALEDYFSLTGPDEPERAEDITGSEATTEKEIPDEPVTPHAGTHENGVYSNDAFSIEYGDKWTTNREEYAYLSIDVDDYEGADGSLNIISYPDVIMTDFESMCEQEVKGQEKNGATIVSTDDKSSVNGYDAYRFAMTQDFPATADYEAYSVKGVEYVIHYNENIICLSYSYRTDVKDAYLKKVKKVLKTLELK